ncbi:unnamed protein product [Durusdinium trenchii]
MMKEVSSSHLYREWQRLFFAHHRSGGTLDNFSTVTFLREVCDVVPLSELAAKEAAAAELHEETSLLEIRLRNIEETELQAAAQAAEESAKGRMLRAELQEQQAVNAGWRSGRLQDSVYKLKLREEQDQHQGHAMELERQLKECEERTSTAAAKARLWRHSAKQMYQEVQPCEVRHGVLEEQVENMASGTAKLQRKVEMQEFQLGHRNLVQLWSSEATQAGRMGQEHQSQALALLRHSALIRADEQNAQQELHGLWSELAETHREAAQQTAALRRTTELREAVEKDVLGLRETTACLGQQRWRTQQELHYAEGVAASPRLKAKLSGGALVPALQLPEGYAGSTPTQVSLRSSLQSGPL